MFGGELLGAGAWFPAGGDGVPSVGLLGVGWGLCTAFRGGMRSDAQAVSGERVKGDGSNRCFPA